VRTDGQTVQSTSNVDLLARRPDRMRVEVGGVGQPRLFFFK
jgi:hypothetical protein